MKNKTGWIVAIVFGVLLLLALPVGYMIGRALPWARYGMMGQPGMMGDWGVYMHPFGGAGMFLGWLIPLCLLGLVVIGIVALVIILVRPNASPPPPSQALQQAPPPQPEIAPERTCPSCGKPAQADWTTCPYCGSPLT